jgi:hypothetical protein
VDPSQDRRFGAFVAAFDAGRYFEAHEHLEEVWQEHAGPDRDALRGLVQVAVALTHRQRGNRPGARRVGERAIQNLAPWFPERFGLDLAALCRGLRRALVRFDDPHAAPRLTACRPRPGERVGS